MSLHTSVLLNRTAQLLATVAAVVTAGDDLVDNPDVPGSEGGDAGAGGGSGGGSGTDGGALLAPRDWTAGLVAEYVARNVLSVLTVLVNLLVLLTLWATPSLRTAANRVLGSLAVTDLLVGLTGPGGLLIELQLLLSPLLCRLGYATMLAFCSVSINHLVFISVDRYLLISKSLRYPSLVTERRVWMFIAGCWTWGGVLSLTFMLGLSLRPDWTGECRAELMYQLWFIVVLVLLHFLLPLVVMIFVHLNIFVVARRQQNAVKNSFRTAPAEAHSGGSATTGAAGREEDGGRRLSTVSSCRAKLRAARLLVLPCGYFYVSWGPWFGVVLWAICTGSTVEPHGLERLVQTLAVLNSLGNPVLYAVSQPLLGKAMMVRLRAMGPACRNRCGAGDKGYRGKPFESIDLVKHGSIPTECAAV